MHSVHPQLALLLCSLSSSQQSQQQPIADWIDLLPCIDSKLSLFAPLTSLHCSVLSIILSGHQFSKSALSIGQNNNTPAANVALQALNPPASSDECLYLLHRLLHRLFHALQPVIFFWQHSTQTNQPQQQRSHLELQQHEEMQALCSSLLQTAAQHVHDMSSNVVQHLKSVWTQPMQQLRQRWSAQLPINANASSITLAAEIKEQVSMLCEGVLHQVHWPHASISPQSQIGSGSAAAIGSSGEARDDAIWLTSSPAMCSVNPITIASFTHHILQSTQQPLNAPLIRRLAQPKTVQTALRSIVNAHDASMTTPTPLTAAIQPALTVMSSQLSSPAASFAQLASSIGSLTGASASTVLRHPQSLTDSLAWLSSSTALWFNTITTLLQARSHKSVLWLKTSLSQFCFRLSLNRLEADIITHLKSPALPELLLPQSLQNALVSLFSEQHRITDECLSLCLSSIQGALWMSCVAPSCVDIIQYSLCFLALLVGYSPLSFRLLSHRTRFPNCAARILMGQKSHQQSAHLPLLHSLSLITVGLQTSLSILQPSLRHLTSLLRPLSLCSIRSGMHSNIHSLLICGDC